MSRRPGQAVDDASKFHQATNRKSSCDPPRKAGSASATRSCSLPNHEIEQLLWAEHKPVKVKETAAAA